MQRCSIMPEHFNPRSLAGATCYFGSHTYDTRISIHAPLRERLVEYRHPKRYTGYFNPRSLTGATLISFTPSLGLSGFQSTLPYGSDKRLRSSLIEPSNFNPRSLARATASALNASSSGSISIHAPSRERRNLL